MNEFAFRNVIGASVDRVFAALTEPGALETWLDEHAEVSLANGRFDFWGRHSLEGERGRKRLLSAEPDRALSFTWLLGGRETTVEIALEPSGDGATLITVRQRNLAERDGADPDISDFWRLSIDNLANFCEGRPIAPRCDIPAMEWTTARAEVEIAVSPEEVFAALIEPELVSRWAGGNATIEPHVGGRYDFGWEQGPIKILDLEPNKTLAYSWNYKDPNDTVVRWELDGSQGRTRLTLVHSGFTDRKTSGGYNMGWQAYLVTLRRMLEVGPSWRPVEWLEGGV